MKKLIGSFLGVAILASGMVGVSNAMEMYYAKADADLGYAEYVSIEHAPKIDGVIDDVWDLGVSGVSTNGYRQVLEDNTTAIVDIMWNETGLYFLARITDYSVNSDDRVNLWVSERRLTLGETYEENFSVYPVVDGAYFLCLNPAGVDHGFNNYRFGELEVDMEGKFTAIGEETPMGYIVEVYVPLTGESPLKLNNSIGFDVSVDNYLQEGEECNSFATWAYVGEYWSFPRELGEVVLVNQNEANGSPITDTENDNDSNSSFVDNGSSTGSSSTGASSEEDKGCASSVVGRGGRELRR